MKLYIISALISTVTPGTIPQWGKCKFDDDCATDGDKCCNASNPPAIAATLCGPPTTFTVPPPTTTYNGWAFKCKQETKASSLTIGYTIAAILYLLQ